MRQDRINDINTVNTTTVATSNDGIDHKKLNRPVDALPTSTDTKPRAAFSARSRNVESSAWNPPSGKPRTNPRLERHSLSICFVTDVSIGWLGQLVRIYIVPRVCCSVCEAEDIGSISAGNRPKRRRCLRWSSRNLVHIALAESKTMHHTT